MKNINKIATIIFISLIALSTSWACDDDYVGEFFSNFYLSSNHWQWSKFKAEDVVDTKKDKTLITVHLYTIDENEYNINEKGEEEAHRVTTEYQMTRWIDNKNIRYYKPKEKRDEKFN